MNTTTQISLLSDALALGVESTAPHMLGKSSASGFQSQPSSSHLSFLGNWDCRLEPVDLSL